MTTTKELVDQKHQLANNQVGTLGNIVAAVLSATKTTTCLGRVTGTTSQLDDSQKTALRSNWSDAQTQHTSLWDHLRTTVNELYGDADAVKGMAHSWRYDIANPVGDIGSEGADPNILRRNMQAPRTWEGLAAEAYADALDNQCIALTSFRDAIAGGPKEEGANGVARGLERMGAALSQWDANIAMWTNDLQGSILAGTLTVLGAMIPVIHVSASGELGVEGIKLEVDATIDIGGVLKAIADVVTELTTSMSDLVAKIESLKTDAAAAATALTVDVPSGWPKFVTWS